MTQSEHNLIALIVGLIIYQIIFHTYLKHRPVARKSMKELSDILTEYFRK